jgi:hypothetical protein
MMKFGTINIIWHGVVQCGVEENGAGAIEATPAARQKVINGVDGMVILEINGVARAVGKSSRRCKKVSEAGTWRVKVRLMVTRCEKSGWLARKYGTRGIV